MESCRLWRHRCGGSSSCCQGLVSLCRAAWWGLLLVSWQVVACRVMSCRVVSSHVVDMSPWQESLMQVVSRWFAGRVRRTSWRFISIVTCHISCHAMSCQVMSRHAMLFDVVSRHTSRRVMHVVSCRVMLYRVASPGVVSCCVVSCHVVDKSR